MAKDPAFLFYPGDWLGGTMGMTFEQKGCYFELLMLQFNLGKFTEQQAKHTLGASYDDAWQIVKVKFETDGTHYWNVKLSSEKEKRKNFTDSRKKNLHKQPHMMNHTEKRMENENEDVNEDVVKAETEIFGKSENLCASESELINNSIWLSQVGYSQRISSIEEVKKWLKIFIDEQIAKQAFSGRTRRDIMNHFVSWLKIELSKIKNSNKFNGKGKPTIEGVAKYIAHNNS